MASVCIRALCWNTALYQQGNGRTPIDWSRVEDVLSFVEMQLGDGSTVALLQEIPYVSNQTWARHPVFAQLRRRFPPQRYDLLYNLSSRHQILMTALLAPKGLLRLRESSFSSNRKVMAELAGAGIPLLCIHAKNGRENRGDLLSLQKAGVPLIAGDFNAGAYSGCENRDAFQALLDVGYQDMCRGEPTTVYKTPIDHVLVRNPHMVEDIQIHREIRFSDHFPITFRLMV